MYQALHCTLRSGPTLASAVSFCVGTCAYDLLIDLDAIGAGLPDDQNQTQTLDLWKAARVQLNCLESTAGRMAGTEAVRRIFGCLMVRDLVKVTNPRARPEQTDDVGFGEKINSLIAESDGAGEEAHLKNMSPPQFRVVVRTSLQEFQDFANLLLLLRRRSPGYPQSVHPKVLRTYAQVSAHSHNWEQAISRGFLAREAIAQAPYACGFDPSMRQNLWYRLACDLNAARGETVGDFDPRD
ncbi:unnamed protein product [Zymoseptoria tritici ST99CH_1E4]|uniref:Uncharacterized protein n=1 Tax=Zymoseptoria tritici ST99CH_1E4 TaxID=1276532 RepID=A0A2H1H928_ZYMTR|nr:unnamed protein product [Zymoseptoria tritici ST99CH_1E4]